MPLKIFLQQCHNLSVDGNVDPSQVTYTVPRIHGLSFILDDGTEKIEVNASTKETGNKALTLASILISIGLFATTNKQNGVPSINNQNVGSVLTRV